MWDICAGVTRDRLGNFSKVGSAFRAFLVSPDDPSGRLDNEPEIGETSPCLGVEEGGSSDFISTSPSFLPSGFSS